MIEEAYVSFETAKLLKEKEFDEDCQYWYEEDISEPIRTNDDYGNQSNSDHISKDFICAVPTQQMAMKWLREVYNIFIVIEPHMYDYINEKNSSYVASLWQGDNYYENITSKDYPTYEEAVEAAIQYSLKNLI